MYKPFDQIAASSRVWVYQLNRSLTSQESEWVVAQLTAFCDQWQAHGASLVTSFHIAYDHFVIMAVDEASGGASGCSIDGSVHVLKAIASKVGVDFFDRTKAAFLADDKIELYPLNKLKELFAEGVLKPSDITFNNLVETKSEFLNAWMVPVVESWLSKYLPKKALA